MIDLFAYHNGNNGVSMYRVWQPLKHLGDGFRVDRVPDRSERVHWDGLRGPCNVPGIGSHAEIIDEHDVIFSNFKATEEDCCRLSITAKLKKLVIDLDDDILHMPTDNQNYKYWFNEENGKDIWQEIPEGEEERYKEIAKRIGASLRVNPKTGRLCIHEMRRHPWEMVLDELRAAHLVTVSTPKLKEIYGRYNPNTVVIPNAIDFDNYPAIVPPVGDGLIRLGLFGSNSHYRDWKTIAKVLKSILDEFPNVRLCYNTWYRAKGQQGSSMDEQELTLIFPDYFDKLGLRDHPQVEVFAGVEIEHYHEWLLDKRIDIGLAPLCDSEFNKSKSNLKYLEFSAMRVPGVYQDMEPYNRDVKGGYNGFLASDTSDWLRCIRALILNEGLRRKMGDLAYQDVRTRYDQRDVSRRLGAEIRKLMGEQVEEVPDFTASKLVLAR